MKVLVSVKRVVDPYVRIRVSPDGKGVDTQNVKMAMNPFDEIALEEAIRWREAGRVSEIVVVSIGNDTVEETLRHALALGADRAILVKTESHYSSLNIAKIIKAITLNEAPQVVLMGKQAIDSDNNQTPQMLAGLLNWPQATFVSKLEWQEGSLDATREIDGGLETLNLKLPAVISTDLRLNEPRYASLPNIMKAKKKPLEHILLDSLNLNLNEPSTVLSVKAPSVRKGGVILDSMASLIDKLQQAQVL